MRPELTLLYVHGESIGYGRLGVKLAEALVNRGVDVYDDLGEPRDETDLTEADQMVAHGRKAKETNVVCWVSVPTHARQWREGQHVGIFTMWEATKLPESFRETLHNFDICFVPSVQNVELFSKYHPDVRYVPLGIDPKEWYPTRRRDPERTFNFLIAGSGARKGTDLAYRAFGTVFGQWFNDGHYTGPGVEPRLVMKNPKAENFYSAYTDMVPGRLTGEEERTLYETAHVYIGPARGEGFGLQPLQAMAQGIPTILTNAHGHASFAQLGIPISTSMETASYFIYGDAGEWWLPDFEELCEAMWDTYNNYEPHRDRAWKNAQIISKNWTWDETARLYMDHYGSLPTDPPRLTGRWIKPEMKLYPVRVRMLFRADIAGKVYQFQPGITYYEMADVKRILFEAGKLDLECLTAIGPNGEMDWDSGLTESQVARIPEYSAAHGHCYACGQVLNSGIQHADTLVDA